MKNRIPPYYNEVNLERPTISHPDLTLEISPMGFLVFHWITPGGIFYQEKYHVETNARIGWSFSHERLEN